jgi:hypothetical protein
MKRSTIALLLGVTTGCNGGVVVTSGDDAGNAPPTVPVGAACVPSPELSPGFGGFSPREVSVDQGNAACGGGVCLVDHFQGRTTCPDGQSGSGQPGSCTVPGTGAPVTTAVQPWCADRPAQKAVGCSCRCANAGGRTDDGSAYCACPQGFACTQLVGAVSPNDPLAGGYCIPQGAAYDPTTACATTCAPGVSGCTAPDAGPGGGTATTAFFAALRAGGGCLPQALPVGSGGLSACALFYVLGASDTCAAHAGLADADPQVAASVRAFAMSSQAAVCVVTQLAGDCANSAQSGWCYVAGADAGGCAQTIEITPSGQPPTGAAATLGCP